MKQYLIRTNSNDKKTHIIELGKEKKEKIGLIYADFNLHYKGRDVSREDIVDPKTNSLIGRISLYEKDNIISIKEKGIWKSNLSEFSRNSEYRENGKKINYNRLEKTILLKKEEYKDLEEWGLKYGYFLSGSSISQILCFEKENELSGIVYADDKDKKAFLKGLVLVFSDRIESHDYVFEFMR